MKISIRSKTLRGSGNVKKEERQLDDFSSLDVEGSVAVELVPGDAGPAVVEADDNLIEYLKTDVSGGTLKIWLDSGSIGGGVSGFQTQSPMRVTVPVPGALSSIHAQGSSQVRAKSRLEGVDHVELSTQGSSSLDVTIDAKSVDCSVQGSGKVAVHGTAERCEANVQGSGQLEAAGLQTKTCSVKVSGSGSASVKASNEIDANATGSGVIRCHGSAKVDASTGGNGKVVTA